MAVIGQDRGRHCLQEAYAASSSVAAAPVSLSAGMFTNREALQANRKAPFKHLRVGQVRIGHMGLHRVRAVEARPRSRAPGNGFIILVLDRKSTRLNSSH